MDTSKMKTLEDLEKELFKRPGYKEAYEAIQPQYDILRALIEARIKEKLTQKQLAKKIGIKQSALSRFETGKNSPTFEFLQKVAKGLGLKIVVKKA
jgi:ribosome-binding protein aMBF1 (putative translation factor)